jgi:hypothetical protein
MTEHYIVYSEPTGTNACYCPYMYLTIPTSRAVVTDRVTVNAINESASELKAQIIHMYDL